MFEDKGGRSGGRLSVSSLDEEQVEGFTSCGRSEKEIGLVALSREAEMSGVELVKS